MDSQMLTQMRPLGCLTTVITTPTCEPPSRILPSNACCACTSHPHPAVIQAALARIVQFGHVVTSRNPAMTQACTIPPATTTSSASMRRLPCPALCHPLMRTLLEHARTHVRTHGCMCTCSCGGTNVRQSHRVPQMTPGNTVPGPPSAAALSALPSHASYLGGDGGSLLAVTHGDDDEKHAQAGWCGRPVRRGGSS
jgi:hypothetical protein